MKRRDFVRTVGGVSLGSAMGEFTGAAEPAPFDVKTLFEASSPALHRLGRCMFALLGGPRRQNGRLSNSR
ncbi:MAG: hypothetical protein ACQESR_01045 [Planctomycetota bacterium]